MVDVVVVVFSIGIYRFVKTFYDIFNQNKKLRMNF